jgi:hypothetical protein
MGKLPPVWVTGTTFSLQKLNDRLQFAKCGRLTPEGILGGTNI